MEADRLRRLVEAGREVVARLELDAVLEHLLRTARELTGARYAALGVLNEQRTGLARFVWQGVDEEAARRIGEEPRGRGVLGVLVSDPQALRLRDVAEHPRSFGFPLHHPPMRTFLGVPILIGDEAWGNLYLTEKAGGGEFTAEDEEAAVTLAGWASVAVANARSVEIERLRHAMEAAEEERKRWARELHDETLQGLGALRMSLSAAAREPDPERLREQIAASLDQISGEIQNLRAIITDLRPAALDQLGLRPALEALVARVASVEGLEAEAELELPGKLDPAVETTVYRLVQEALTNVAKHARATRTHVAVAQREGGVDLAVTDDGRGFDPAAPAGGFGLQGMRERVRLAGGTLEVRSGADGTAVRATVPL